MMFVFDPRGRLVCGELLILGEMGYEPNITDAIIGLAVSARAARSRAVRERPTPSAAAAQSLWLSHRQ